MAKLTSRERMIQLMKEDKFAELDLEQLLELTELENKLGVTLVAYDASATFDNTSSETASS